MSIAVVRCEAGAGGACNSLTL